MPSAFLRSISPKLLLLLKRPIGVPQIQEGCSELSEQRAGLGIILGDRRLAGLAVIMASAAGVNQCLRAGYSLPTRRIALISWVTVSWVATRHRAPWNPTDGRNASLVHTGRGVDEGLPVGPVGPVGPTVGWRGWGGGESSAMRSRIWTCQPVTRTSSMSRRSSCCFGCR